MFSFRSQIVSIQKSISEAEFVVAVPVPILDLAMRILSLEASRPDRDGLDPLVASRVCLKLRVPLATLMDAALGYLPDAVLLDIGLPELDGLEVARRIRSNPGSAGVVLIAMTGYGQDDDRRLSREAGFDHHLVKPADFDRITAILATVKGR